MDETGLEKLKAIAQDKTKGIVSMVEAIGNMAIDEDVPNFIKENGRMPTAKEIIDQYKSVPHFESVLGIADIKVERVEKFLNALLAEADIEDFKIPELTE